MNYEITQNDQLESFLLSYKESTEYKDKKLFASYRFDVDFSYSAAENSSFHCLIKTCVGCLRFVIFSSKYLNFSLSEVFCRKNGRERNFIHLCLVLLYCY